MPDATIGQKWDAVGKLLEIRFIVETEDSSILSDDRVVRLTPIRPKSIGGLAFYARLPLAIHRQLKRFRPQAVVTQSPYDAIPALLARRFAGATRTPIIIEVHGDWRTATRLYGSRWRRLLSPFGDAVAVWALRRADAIRAVGATVSAIIKEASGRDPLAVFPTFHDAKTYFEPPLEPIPPVPTALWVGALERAKDPHLLTAAWRVVAEAVPEAQLVVVGSGTLEHVVDDLRNEYPRRVRTYTHLVPSELKGVYDSATALVLSSRSEGLARVVIEAFARSRPVIATEVGGTPDLVKHEVNGLLIPSGDVGHLAKAMIRLLSDRPLAVRLGRRGRIDAEAHCWTVDKYAEAMSSLIFETLQMAANK
jgi:glycogen synthase